MIALYRIALILVAGLFVHSTPSQAASIDLGGVRLRLPSVTVQRPRPAQPGHSGRSVYADPRWYVTVQDTQRFATNDRGIWIGYDEAGDMVMQIQLAAPTKTEPDATFPVQIDINGRYFASVPAALANERLVVVQGLDVERILGRLMSGRTLRVIAADTMIETHLSGSSAAIRSVRDGAMLQKRLYAEGKIQPRQEAKPADEDRILFYLPGVPGNGTAEIRFDIIEGTGLVLYAKFSRVPNYGDPEYAMPFTRTEAERTIALIRKAEDWTEIAVRNRVGLYSKRIGFVDDVHGGSQATEPEETADEGAEKANGNGAGNESETAPEARSDTPEPAAGEDPKDYKAVNFNSYEDGSTSVQLEHAVKGFSRRFNLTLENAMKLAGNMEATLEYATFRLEKRDFDVKEKDKLFK